MKPLHIGISVNNIEKSIAWYGQVLGFELVWSQVFEEVKSKIAFLKNGDFEIELFEHFTSQPIPKDRLLPKSDIETQGTKHVAFGVKDIQTLFENFKKHEVDIVFGPIESPPKDALFGFIRDPSGVLIEIIQKY
jgi:methylmalonyl-CoA/ethylmalonyl-CoA epimerase